MLLSLSPISLPPAWLSFSLLPIACAGLCCLFASAGAGDASQFPLVACVGEDALVVLPGGVSWVFGAVRGRLTKT